MTRRTIDCEMEDEEINQLRRVEPSANESRGRSIVMILYDRSVWGPSGVGGLHRFGRGSSRSMPYAMQASPSSVILRDGANDGDTREESITSGFKILVNETKEESNNNKPLEVGGKRLSKGPSYPPAPLPNNGEPRRPNSHPPSSSSNSPLKFNSFPTNHTNEIRNYGEQYSVTKFNWEYLRLHPKEHVSSFGTGTHPQPPPPPPRIQRNQQRSDESSAGVAISTISIAFSPDGRTMASTHGDHSVKITCCHTGTFVRKLIGHPRTPWTVKYHPLRSNIVASGCLGFQVRVWDWNYRRSQLAPARHAGGDGESIDEQYNYHDRCAVLLNMIRLNCAIISLSFHPTGSLLAVASGQTLHLWNYDAGQQDEKPKEDLTSSSTRRQQHQQQQQHHLPQQYEQQQHQQQSSRMGRRTEIRYEHNLRCVHFPPGGNTIIVGGANPPLPATMAPGGDASYSLKLWDFDLEAALNPHLYLGQQHDHLLPRQDLGAPRRPPTVRRDSLSNSRMFLQRALLYNDGGFDVSPDGKMLCGCAEIFLRQGVKSVMEDVGGQVEQNKARRVSRVTAINGGNDNGSTLSDARADALRQAVPSKEEEETTASIPNSTGAAGCEASLTASPTRERETIEECRTPPTNMQTQIPTTPPSPPGRRWSLQLKRSDNAPPPPPLPQSRYANPSALNGSAFPHGKLVPHVVIVSLDVDDGTLGQLIEATPLGSKASSVTCVKFSPSAEFCLLGYGVRENAPQPVVEHNYHPVSAVYRVRGGMQHIVTMLSGEDDVNIARFHPVSGHGFVYGTKQGRVRVLSPWPWNYYYD